ncbi:VOC family protein [Peribacillus deserti]|uniref:Glyoxalase n=1 Tax=Peribacillus deserti TaxID=673318 RepID=A0A2N5MAI9_9BACI|nr:VOC family protein [Peribacillus deserti]PLT31388.1 glyoxalase [Peribacillus deserti]
MVKIMDPKTHIGLVHLIVSNLEESCDFYLNKIGFKELVRDGSTVSLTANGKTPLVILEEREDAKVKPERTTGLYHFAILVPNRASLGQSLLHLLQVGYPLQGASDHGFSEAVYLADPDGNGIEIYADRPREQWEKTQNGEYKAITMAMDAEGVLAEASNGGWAGLPDETVIGHIHLHVDNLIAAENFYIDGIGFEKTIKMAESALFVSAGGYHHHLGLNVWAGIGAPHPPLDSLGLKHYTIEVAGNSDLDEMAARLHSIGAEYVMEDGFIRTADPSGNVVLILAG